MAFTDVFQAFRGTLGIGALLCPRADPETKGVIERNKPLPRRPRSCPGAASRTPATSTASSVPGS